MNRIRKDIPVGNPKLKYASINKLFSYLYNYSYDPKQSKDVVFYMKGKVNWSCIERIKKRQTWKRLIEYLSLIFLQQRNTDFFNP